MSSIYKCVLRVPVHMRADSPADALVLAKEKAVRITGILRDLNISTWRDTQADTQASVILKPTGTIVPVTQEQAL